MGVEELSDELGDVLRETGVRQFKLGEYHPSTISGCPLKSVLNTMTGDETVLNCWLFQGSAVHYYLQEHPSPVGYDGIITEALHNSGFHSIDNEYEVPTKVDLGDGVTITGTCDILTQDEDGNRWIFDIKYSSVKPSTHKGRLMKYLSQVNCYSHMFDADRHGLILINNKAGKNHSDDDSIPEGVRVVDGEPQEDNWEIHKEKARAIHKVLVENGYEGGTRWTTDMLESADLDFWKSIMDIVDSNHCPSYSKECRYCDHEDYCPVAQGKLGGGLSSFKGGTD